MYLNDAANLDEIITYGLNPLVELMNIFEDEIELLDDMDPDSRESILWIEIKAKAFLMREVAKKINHNQMTLMKKNKDNPKLIKKITVS